jgi:molybdopterin/thiamine biosynthesis adenylyltransferase
VSPVGDPKRRKDVVEPFALDPTRLARATVLLGGAGNIGTHAAVFLARAGVGRLRIVDRDRVEAKNLANQDFRPRDVGAWKADALAERLRSEFPSIAVESLTTDIEDVPLGRCDVDLVVGAFDSRRARQALVAEIAWPLGVPAVDGGVGEGLLGRVQVFAPGPMTACLECGWGKSDYARLSAEYPCVPGEPAEGPSTVSPAFAGGVVGGLIAAEAVKILAGPQPEESSEIAFDLFNRRFLVSRLRRNPRCRFDHVVPERLTLGRTFDTATVGDLVEIVESSGPAPATLEFRRGLFGRGFTAGRYVSPEQLRPRGGEPLAALGLVADDIVRVRTGGGSALVAFV